MPGGACIGFNPRTVGVDAHIHFGGINGQFKAQQLIARWSGSKGPAVLHASGSAVEPFYEDASVGFDQVPAFYFLASTRPLNEIASAAVFAPKRIGATNLYIVPQSRVDVGRTEFRRALLRNKAKSGLYNEVQGAVKVTGGRLFQTRVFFPSNVPTGNYAAEVYLLRGGVIVSDQSTPLVVRKVGLESDIFQFAHQHSALYGIIAIVIALAAGWLAGVVFRKA